MKKKLFISAIALCLASQTFSQNSFPGVGSVGIGTTIPNSSALIEVNSTSQGVLISRMTKTQRDAIPSPANGLLIYQTNNTAGFYFFNGTAWNALKTTAGASKTLNNLTGTTAVNAALVPDISNTRDLGSSVSGWKDHYLTGSILFDGSRFIANGNTSVMIGDSAGVSVTSGFDNTVIGFNALRNASTANQNTACGSYSMFSTSTGSSNTALGDYSLYSNTIGTNNIAVGVLALYQNSSGTKNIAIGSSALLANTTGNNNIGIGYLSLDHNITGANNTAMGYFALDQNHTGANNVAVGSLSLSNNNSGFSNVAIGNSSLYKNTTKSNLVAVGDSALYNNGIGAVLSYEGAYNTALGSKVLYLNTTGGFCTGTGFEALKINSTGLDNTATGSYSLTANTTGRDNTAIGFNSLYGNSSGDNNTAVGSTALAFNATGSFNTAIGYGTGTTTTALSNATAIGSNAQVNASNKMQLGSSTTVLATTGGITIVSDGRFKDNVKTEDVPGLDFITKLKPVTYNFNYKRYDDFLRKDLKENLTNNDYQKELIEKGKIREVGFIAQEVDKTVHQNHFTFNGVYTPQNENDNYAIDYSRMVVPLVKSVQELSVQNEELKKNLAEMQRQINSIAENTEKSKMSNPDLVPQVHIAPNPAHDMAIITITSNDAGKMLVIKIVDASGKTVNSFHSETISSTIEMNTSTLAQGTYLVQVFNQDQLVNTARLIVQ